MRRRASPLRRLFALPAREVADLVRAQLELIATRSRLKKQPTGTLIQLAGAAEPASASAPLSAAQVKRAKALALAVDRAAEYGVIRAVCLLRATSLQRLLVKESIVGGRVRIGVRNVGGRFAAHAWVELGEHVLGDLPRHVQTFATADEIGLVSL